MAKKQPEPQEETEQKLCDKCGSLMLQDEAGKWYCPNCDGEIDWGLEDVGDV